MASITFDPIFVLGSKCSINKSNDNGKIEKKRKKVSSPIINCQYVGVTLTLCRCYVDLMLVLCRPYVGIMLTLCRCYVDLYS